MKISNFVFATQLLAASLTAALPLADGAGANIGSTLSSPTSLGERFVLKIREDAAVAEGYAPDAGDHGCSKKKRHAVAAISAASQAYDELANALSERDIMDPHTDEDLRKKRDAEEAASTARRAYAELEESLLKRKMA